MGMFSLQNIRDYAKAYVPKGWSAQVYDDAGLGELRLVVGARGHERDELEEVAEKLKAELQERLPLGGTVKLQMRLRLINDDGRLTSTEFKPSPVTENGQAFADPRRPFQVLPDDLQHSKHMTNDAYASMMKRKAKQ